VTGTVTKRADSAALEILETETSVLNFTGISKFTFCVNFKQTNLKELIPETKTLIKKKTTRTFRIIKDSNPFIKYTWLLPIHLIPKKIFNFEISPLRFCSVYKLEINIS